MEIFAMRSLLCSGVALVAISGTAPAITKLKANDFGSYADPSLGTLPVNLLSTVDITNGNSIQCFVILR